MDNRYLQERIEALSEGEKETYTEGLIARIEALNAEVATATEKGLLFTLTHAAKMINVTRQNFSKPIASGQLAVVRHGGQRLLSMRRLRDYRANLAFEREGHVLDGSHGG